MWILSKHPKISGKNSEPGSLEYYLLEGREYIVGRKDCDIVIPGDVSVSRKHAIIKPLVQGKNAANFQPNIHLTDTSKTGILVNGNKLDTNKQVYLSDGDILCFGKMQNKFKFSYVNINVLTSCVTGRDDKMKVKSLVKKLGGRVHNEWHKSITHLVMGKLTFTMKVVNALACGVPIVSIKFLEEYFDCCDQKKGKKLPNTTDYLPVIAESNLMNKEYLLQPNEYRKSLFSGKNFVSMIKSQYERIKHAVELSSGTISLKESQDAALFSKLSSQQTIVLFVETRDMNSVPAKQKKWIENVYKKVESHNLRTVRETEIGLAILHRSLQCYCNPAGKEASNLSQVVTDTMPNTQLSQSQTQPVQEAVFKQPFPIQTVSGSESEKEQEIRTVPDSEDDSETHVVEETQKHQPSSRKRGLNDSVSDNVSNLKKRPKTNIVEDSFDVKEEIDPFDAEINSFLEEEFQFEDPKNEASTSKTKQQTSSSSKPKHNNVNSFFVSDTVPSTARANQVAETSNFVVSDTFGVSAKTVNDGYANDSNKNPFDFDMDEFSITSTSKNQIKEILDSSLQEESLKIDDIQQQEMKRELSESRFLKAVASTQESEVSASQNFDCAFDSQPTASNKQNGKKNIDPTPCPQSHATPTAFLQKSSDAQSSKSFDEEIAPSEEYLPIKASRPPVSAKGFICVSNKKSTVTRVKEDPDLEGVTRNLIQVEEVSLVKLNNQYQRKNRQVVTKRKVKNFKCFRKQNVRGGHIQNTRKIDLVVYESQNEEQDCLFREFREELDREEEEIRNADRLFNWESQ